VTHPSRVTARSRISARVAAGESALARSLFHASLHAALTVDEARAAAEAASLRGVTVAKTSDRHWTLTRPRR
jgi:hypothetical protein